MSAPRRSSKVYEHRTPEDHNRAIEVRVIGGTVRVVCDAPGIAAVSHVLSWQEWDELVHAVDAALLDERNQPQ